MVNWLKREWLTVLIAVGILFSLYVIVVSGSKRDEKDRAASIAGCMRGSERTALEAAFQFNAAQARRADGNADRAAYYEGIADGMLLTIPAPSPDFRGNHLLMEVKKVHVLGRDRYVLTNYARNLHREGCTKAYVS